MTIVVIGGLIWAALACFFWAVIHVGARDDLDD